MISFKPVFDIHCRPLTSAVLDSCFGPCAVTISSRQLAVQAVLESLGSRMIPIPVILPVTSSQRTLAGVLRSGATPIILDIEKDTFQMSPKLVKEILGELPDGAAVILPTVNGAPVNPELYKACAGFPTIEVTSQIPHLDLSYACFATFTIFDLSTIIDEGAVIHHAHADQLAAIKYVRSGPMGAYGEIAGPNADWVLNACAGPKVNKFWQQQRTLFSEYKEKLSEYMDCDKLYPNQSTFPSYVLCRTENSAADVADLRMHSIEARRGVYGLHHLPEIQERFMDMPEYPVADELMKTTVALPLSAVPIVADTFLSMKADD